MEIEKYSPKCLLEKINDSKTDAHKLMHIIEYRKEIVESTEKQLTLTDASQQRELLIAFHEFLQANYCLQLFDSEKIKVIEEFEATNCG